MTGAGDPAAVRGLRRGRAVWFTSPGKVAIVDEEVPSPGSGEVTVQTIASLISPGTEVTYLRGEVPVGLDVGLPTAVRGASGFPVKFGYSCVGRVCAAGADVEDFLDALVFVRHPHQDLFTAPVLANSRPVVRRIPAGMTPETAVFTNLAEVALNALLDVPVRLGDVVVVFGCGIVGLCMCRLARRTAGRIIAVDPLPERLALARSLGVDVAVPPDEAAAATGQVSEGRGADVVFEASGAPAGLQGAIRVAGVSGTVAVASFFGTRKVELSLAPEFHLRAQRIVSTMVGRLDPALGPRWDYRRRGEVALAILPDLSVETMITHRVPFDRAEDGFAVAADPSSGGLGIILDYGTADPAGG